MSDDDLMPVTRGMLRRWRETLMSDLPPGRRALVVAEAIFAVLDVDTSPDPEGAEAAVLAPKSATARDVDAWWGSRASTPCPRCGHEQGEHTPSCEKGISGGRPCGCFGPQSDAAEEAR